MNIYSEFIFSEYIVIENLFVKGGEYQSNKFLKL